MEIRDRQQICLAIREPLGFGERLTLRAMAIATGVIRNTLMVTAVTGFDVPTQGSRATTLNGAHDPPLSAGERCGVGLPISCARGTKNIGHF
jgi:hypothetical protein